MIPKYCPKTHHTSEKNIEILTSHILEVVEHFLQS